MKLVQLLKNVEYTLQQGSLEIEIEKIAYHSKKVEKNSVFFAMNGANTNGDIYIEEAIQRGAIAIVTQNADIQIPDVTIIVVQNIRHVLALVSCEYFCHPASKLKVIGITGTKGKTTTAMMVYQLLLNTQHKVGYIGTNGAYIDQCHHETINTTPESYEIQSLFAMMVDYGCEYVVMEVSSIGLLRHRLDGFVFDIGCFTNLSNDHIGPNEHESFDEYKMCKAMLFARSKYSIINDEDVYANTMISACNSDYLLYSLNHIGNHQVTNIHYILDENDFGMGFTYQGYEFKIMLPGEFNVFNAVLAIAIGNYIGLSLEEMSHHLASIFIQGRSEFVPTYKGVKVLIDYAHNAVSMEKICQMAKHYHPKRLITLFGCGGNRAKSRRFEMGRVSGEYADLSIITSDNSRLEPTKNIIEDIIQGITPTNGKYVTFEDRKEAIHYALDNAQFGDIILILGKGHEMYQIIGETVYPFNERQIILDYVKNKG